MYACIFLYVCMYMYVFTETGGKFVDAKKVFDEVMYVCMYVCNVYKCTHRYILQAFRRNSHDHTLDQP